MMKWVEPRHSRNRVRKAGETLCKVEDVPPKEFREALVALMNWRGAHAYPMHCLLMLLRGKSADIDNNALVVQRLKRLPSVVGKLLRFKQMSLDRMHDIAGCRAVVKDLSKVRQLRDALRTCRTRHKFQREYDYISRPKDSGYRAIHLVYKYGGRKKIFGGLLVEVQLRSKVQHSWATAVEVVDTFTRQSLKTSQGSAEWTEFFCHVGDAFAMIEGTPPRANRSWHAIRNDVISSAEALHVEHTLRSFAVTTLHLTKQKQLQSYEFFLLQLNANDLSIRIQPYRQANFTVASKEYLKLEQATREDDAQDVVLVAASSIKALEQAYRNYFADTGEFLNNLNLVLDNKTLENIRA